MDKQHAKPILVEGCDNTAKQIYATHKVIFLFLAAKNIESWKQVIDKWAEDDIAFKLKV